MSEAEKTPMHRFRTEEIQVDPGPPRLFADRGARSFFVALGTSTPSPNPFRLGPAGAVVADGEPYLIDAGEGILRALAKAATAHGRLLVDGFAPKKLRTVFLTHLHSDHVVGLPSLILNPWIFGREAPMRIYGPKGTKNLVAKLLEAYEADIRERIHGAEGANDTGWRVSVQEIERDGVVLEDGRIVVRAFLHEHGTLPNLGYRFDAPGKSMLWAGDGKAGDGFLDAARGVDFLFSELCTLKNVANSPWGGLSAEEKERVIWSYHLKPAELARLAEAAGVGTLVLIHESNYSRPYDSEALLKEMREEYAGKLISSRDADVF